MLISYTQLLNIPVVSLHIGGKLAQTTACIVDPDNLKIIAFIVEGSTITADTGDVLNVKSIREFSRLGFIIDSIDDIMKREDVIRVQEIIDLDFSLINLQVRTEKGEKLGKISDFIVDSRTNIVQQLVVKRPTLKSFLDPELVIHRNQIIEINDTTVIVKDAVDKKKVVAPAANTSSKFVNPFRKPNFSQSDSQNLDAPDIE